MGLEDGPLPPDPTYRSTSHARSGATDKSPAAPPAKRGRTSSRPPEAESEPTVLLVGAEQSFHQAIAAALAQRGVYVETSPINGVVETVVATAPDLVVLVGEAAADGGSASLASLHTSPHSSVVPVAILVDDSALAERLRAFRHGAAAVIPRSASVDAMAEQMARLAREIPDRDREALGNVGEATLNELVEALSKELRTGILSVRTGKSSDDDDEAVRIVLGGGRPLAQTIDEFVARIRRHVVHAEPLHYEFDERAGGTVHLFGGDAMDAAKPSEDVTGLRVLLADLDAARADAIAQAFREHGASVVVTDFEPSDQRFGRLRQLDPAILMIDEPALHGAGFKLVRRMRRDTRLRWTSLLVARWEDVWEDKEETPEVSRVLGTLATLAEPERALRGRVEVGHAFDTRLEITGPARMLRALAACSQAIRVVVYNPRVQVRVDLSEHLITGARGQTPDGTTLDGAPAIAALLMLSSGRAHVERIHEPELVNIMATVDVALNLAESETPPIQPSLPAPPEGASNPPPGTAVGMLSLAPPRRKSRAASWLWLPVALLGICVIAGAVVFIGTGQLPDIRSLFHPGASATTAPLATTKTSSRRAPAAPETAGQTPEVVPVPAASSAAEPTPETMPPEELKKAEEDPARMALALEHHVNAPTCAQAVGPSWSLLNADQPTRAMVEIHAGRRALMLGKLDQAQLSFCRATVLDPENPESFISLARLFLLQRDPKQAKEWAERGAKNHPENMELQGLYGDALARLGEIDRAVTVWLESVKIDPADAASVRGVAYTFSTGGERALKGADFAQADRLFRRSALLDPSNAKAASGMARTLLLQDEAKAALAWAKRAAALDPRDGDIRLVLGDALDKAGNTKEAYEAWKLAYELDARSTRAYSRLQRIPPEMR